MSAEAALAAALKRDGTIALVALLAIAALAWLWILRLAGEMAAMATPEMSGVTMSHMQMMSPELAPWSLPLALYLLAMWVVMMIGMMTPAVAPMVLIYLRVAGKAANAGHPFASVAWFFSGYLLAWVAFSLVATLAQWLLESAAMMTPGMQTASRHLGGAVLFAAGLYQFLPAKKACLSGCRTPLLFIEQHGGFQREALPSMRLGLVHGLYCVGCCGALMALLFVFGVMNLLWIAGLMIFVLLEKVAPRVEVLTWVAGLVAMGGGLWMLAGQ